MWFGCFCMKSCWYTGVYRYLFYIHTTMFSFNTVYAVFQVSMVQKPSVWVSFLSLIDLSILTILFGNSMSCLKSASVLLVRFTQGIFGNDRLANYQFHHPSTPRNPSIPYVERTSKFWQLPTLPLRYQRRYSQLPVISGHPSESQGWFLFFRHLLTYLYIYAYTGLVVSTYPLKNDGVRQLGSWNSQFMDKPTSILYIYIDTTFDF